MHQSALSIVRDYIVSTTYRKHEQNGSNWTAWQPRPQDVRRGKVAAEGENFATMFVAGSSPMAAERRPVRQAMFETWEINSADGELGRLGDILKGKGGSSGASSAQRLANVLHYTATPLRWEPTNTSAQHRGIPSPSSLFLAELLLVGRNNDGGSAEVFRYIPHSRLLAKIHVTGSLDEMLGDADFAFVVVGQLSRCLEPYGDFSPCLVGLEAGHIQAQLSLLCSGSGWHSQGCILPLNQDIRQSLGLKHWTEIPMTVLRVYGAANALPCTPGVRRELVDRALPLSEADEYPRLRALVRALESDDDSICCPLPNDGSTQRFESADWQDTDLAQVIRSRSSGSFNGIAPFRRRICQKDIDTVIGLATCLRRDSSDAFSRASVELRLAVRHGDSQIDGLYNANLRGAPATKIASPSDWQTLQMRTHAMARESSLVITLAVDDLAELERWGTRAFLIEHLAAGAEAQRLCLAAATCGLRARPIKAYADFLVDAALPLHLRSIYQLVCCFEQHSTISFDLP